MCNSTNRGGNKCGGQVSAGEEVEAGVEAGLDLGRAEGLLATCRHGRGPDGGLVEERAGGSSDLGRGRCSDTHGVDTQEPTGLLRTRMPQHPYQGMYHTLTRATDKQNKRRLENVVA